MFSEQNVAYYCDMGLCLCVCVCVGGWRDILNFLVGAILEIFNRNTEELRE